MCDCQLLIEFSVKNNWFVNRELKTRHGLPVYQPLTLLRFLTRMWSVGSSVPPF